MIISELIMPPGETHIGSASLLLLEIVDNLRPRFWLTIFRQTRECGHPSAVGVKGCGFRSVVLFYFRHYFGCFLTNIWMNGQLIV